MKSIFNINRYKEHKEAYINLRIIYNKKTMIGGIIKGIRYMITVVDL